MTDLSQRIASLPPEKRALLEAKLLGEKPATAAAIPRRAGSGPAPLSFAQRRLWFLDQLDPGRPYYNLPLALRLKGDLDVGALARALDAIVSRHESLRTTFASKDGEPFQIVAPASRLALERRDLSGLPPGERAAALRRLLAEELARPFTLSRDPMLRASLVREDERSHVLVLLMHHIVSDGWSIGVLLEELAEGYGASRGGREPAPPALPIQYGDYAAWQRDWLAGAIGDAQLAYWKERLAGDLPLLALPSDRPRPARQSYRGAQERRLYPRELADRLEALARESGATLFMTLLAAFQGLLVRLTGQEDVLVGTPVAGRGRVETENLVGFFVNTLVVRADLSGNPTFREVLGRVRERALEAYQHQDVPFERLVETLRPERDLSHSPLFQAMFAFENYPLEQPAIPGLSVENVEFETAVSNFDVTLEFSKQERGLAALLEYQTDLFDRETAARWLANLEVLLAAAVENPDRRLWDLPVLTPEERERLVVGWNATRAEFSLERCVHELFEARAASSPDAPAAESENGRLTYRELDARANALARRLAEAGVGPDVPVGVCLERSLEAGVALLAVLKAGGCYVPLDPAHPTARLRYFLEDAGARVLVTDAARAESSPAGPWRLVRVDAETARPEDGAPVVSGVRPENLAYVIYTSGSTGLPKGVEVPHRALVNHAEAIRRAFGLAPSDRVLQFASLSFDVAAEEIFPTWAAGAAVVFRPGEAIGVPEFEALLAARKPTVVNLPAGFWHQWVAEISRRPRTLPDSLRLVVAGSERVLPDRLEDWKRQVPNVRWLNGYGPTETTITATLYEPAPGEGSSGGASVPIGRPIANARLYVVDPHDGLAPQGAAGELWIGGEGVARGYRGAPDRTAERFRANPFGPGRVYRTGDRARYRKDGNVEFLGRSDAQVKVRGFRIELAEIESALERHPAVREAAVAAREDGGENRLVAYVVFAGGDGVPTSDLRAFLREQLPPYMIPAAFVTLDALPRTASDKIDRDRLPDPGRLRGDEAFVAPRTPVEEAIAEIWSGLLRVERVGATDNFFDLGGHSLLATQVASRLRDRFGLEIPLKTLFEAPTVGDLALAIAQAQAGQTSAEELARLLEELEGEAPPEGPPT
jgi:amino acid adenylation domain-containing protein